MRPTTRRAAEVATVLARHGLGSMVDFLELHGTRGRKRRAAAPPRRVGPAHLRHALEELGPAFVKLGQVLSTRPDLVPPEYETELSILQDAAPATPTREITRVIEDALGQSIREAYPRFDGAPLACASIGQVHAATLPDGTDVVVKVRRPGVTETIDLDLAVLARVAATAARRPALSATTPSASRTSSTRRCTASSTTCARRAAPKPPAPRSTATRRSMCRGSSGVTRATA